MKLELTKMKSWSHCFSEANSPEKTSFTLQPGTADSELEANPTAGEASMHLEGYHFHFLCFYLSDYTFRQQNPRKETLTGLAEAFPFDKSFVPLNLTPAHNI